MFRKRFGTAEIVAVIIGIIGIAALGHVAYHGSNQEVVTNLGYIKMAWMAIMAAIFGPYTGVIIGVAGTIFSQYFIAQPFWIISAIAYGLYGYIIGAYSEKYKIRSGIFTRKEVALLYFVLVFDNILVFVFFNPLLSFLANKNDLFEQMRNGVSFTTHLTIFSMISVAPICYIINIILRKVIKK